MTLEGSVVAELQRQITDLQTELGDQQVRIARLEIAVEALHDYVTPIPGA